MSMNVEEFRPADDTYRAMKAALDACLAVKARPPKEVLAFFELGERDWEEPSEVARCADPLGVKVELMSHRHVPFAPGVKTYKADMREGFEVDLRLLDPSIKILRFYASF